MELRVKLKNTPFFVGDKVLVSGLLSRTDLNGRTGIVQNAKKGADGLPRLAVKIEGEVADFQLVKPKNLTLHDEPLQELPVQLPGYDISTMAAGHIDPIYNRPKFGNQCTTAGNSNPLYRDSTVKVERKTEFNADGTQKSVTETATKFTTEAWSHDIAAREIDAKRGRIQDWRRHNSYK